MVEFSYVSKRVEGQPRRVLVGPSRHPATELLARMSRLHTANMNAEQAEADSYASHYVGFAKLLDLSFKFLQRAYEAELSQHGFVRLKKQGLRKVEATIDSPTNATASPQGESPTKEMLTALLQRATNCEDGAIAELMKVTAKHPELFTKDFDLLDLVKNAFYSLAASQNSESAKVVKACFQSYLDGLGQINEDPMCRLLFRHMTFYCAITGYNALLSMAPSQPSRTNKAILKRTAQCDLKLKEAKKMFVEYMQLKSNGWSRLPGEKV